MKHHVIGKAMELPLGVARRAGLDQAKLLEGLDFDEEAARSRPYYRVDWEVFAEYLNRLEAEVGEELEALTEVVFVEQKPFELFSKIGGLLTSPKLYFWMANSCFAPVMFPAMSLDIEERGKRGLEIRASLPAAAKESQAFWRICAITFEAGPTLMGMGRSGVRWRGEGREAVFTIDFPKSLTLLARSKRLFDAVLGSRDFMDELREQSRTLEESYQKLRLSEEGFRTLVEHSPEGILITDHEEILFANPALARLLGWKSEKEMIGEDVNLMAVEGEAEELEEKEEKGRAVELRLRRRDGGVVQVEMTKMETFFMGELVCICFFRDVTLRNEIMARALDMDRLITTGTLAAGISHEINNPLTLVSTNLHFLTEELEELFREPLCGVSKDLKGEISAALRDTLGGLERALEITRELKEVGRDVSDYREAVDLRDAIGGAMLWMGSRLSSRAEVVEELQECGRVETNIPRVQQVILNLLLNAKYAVTTKSKGERRVAIRTYRTEGESVVEIEDTGGGIEPEAMEKIFDPFYTTKPRGEGTGLGLFVSRDIVERLGGRLELESVPGIGTTARISFPLLKAQEGRIQR